ncbi:MAG: hypothetical protein KF857_03070 [Fimbriimonadaceae bacterium]|nr:hypothetical protein [Fimbriimonadaceae bacterium]
MAFRLSRCVGVTAPDVNQARDFYTRHMQLRVVSYENGLELGGRDLRLYVDPGPVGPAVLEMVTDDGPAAREKVRRLGFEEKQWRGPGQPCLVVDPWGVVWNVFFDKGSPVVAALENPGPCMVVDRVGVACDEPAEAADFYGTLFDVVPSKTVAGDWTVDSGACRLRVEKGDTGSMLYLASEACFDALVALGCDEVSAAPPRLRDPFGVVWGADAPAPSGFAAVSPGGAQ